MKSCDDGYPSCRQAEATGKFCKTVCAATAEKTKDNIMTPNPQAAAPGVSVDIEKTVSKLKRRLLECIRSPAMLDAREKFEEDLRTALLAGAAGGGEPVAWKWEVLPGTEQYKRKGNKEGVYLEDPASLGIPMEHPSYRWTKLYDHSPPLPVGAPQGVSDEDVRAALRIIESDGYASHTLVRQALESFAASRPVAGALPASAWLPMDSAPKDGTMVRLLVDYSGEHGCNPLEDADQAQTIGANNDSNVGDNEGKGWEFAGWNWQQDHFTHGCGTPIGWLPFVAPSASLATPSPAQAEPTKRDLLQAIADYGTAKEARNDGMTAQCFAKVCELIDGCTLATGAAEGAEPTADAERLEWILHNLSGSALRQINVIPASGGLHFGRIAIDAARAAQKGQP